MSPVIINPNIHKNGHMSYSICDYYDICHRKWQEEYDKFYSTETGNVYKTRRRKL